MTGHRRVVVTGMGAISPLGCDLATIWQRAANGYNPVGPITIFDARSFPTTFAAQVRDFAPEAYPWDPKLNKVLWRGTQLGLASAHLAVADANLEHAGYEPTRVGVALGNGVGRPTVEEANARTYALDSGSGPVIGGPSAFLRQSSSTGASLIATRYRAQGPNIHTYVACSSSAQAIGLSFRMIQHNRADAVITGGYDSMIDPWHMMMFSLLGALSSRNDEPQKASRPFDRNRDGFVMGEGAAMFVLEERACAQARGAKIHAEILGYGSSMDAYRITDSPPDGRGAILAIQSALEDAGISPGEVDYINAHGTSTPDNDCSETAAIKQVFGEHAYRVPISSTKSMTGHLIAAGGALEMLVTILSLQAALIHPTINYEEPDPICDLDYVPNAARPAPLTVALSNSFGFGGNNASLVVARDSR